MLEDSEYLLRTERNQPRLSPSGSYVVSGEGSLICWPERLKEVTLGHSREACTLPHMLIKLLAVVDAKRCKQTHVHGAVICT